MDKFKLIPLGYKDEFGDDAYRAIFYDENDGTHQLIKLIDSLELLDQSEEIKDLIESLEILL